MPAEDATWEWVRSAGSYAQLARYAAAPAVRAIQLVEGRDLDEPDAVVAERLYERLRREEIRYAPEPHLPKAGTQHVRDPWLLLRTRIGTCIDMATTYAAMCLDATTSPLLAVAGDHAFVVVAPGRMLAGPHPSRPLELDGFAPAEEEPAGVLRGSYEALAAAVASGALIAVDASRATLGGSDFAEAVAAVRDGPAEHPVLLVDVLYLQHQPGYGPLDPPGDHRSILRHVPADDTPFVPYESHRAALDALRGRSGTVVLLGPAGRGKSRVARQLAREAPLGAGWFLDASEPQTLIKSLARADRAERATDAAGLAAPDLEGYALNALALLRETRTPWVVVFDNADGDPGKVEHLLPAPGDEQLLLITSTTPEWAPMPGVSVVDLGPIANDEIAVRRGSEDVDVTALVTLIGGLPLLLGAFRELMRATGWSAAAVAEHAPPAIEPPDPLRGQATLWAAVRHASGFGERELRVSAYAAYLPPDHQPLETFDLLEPGGGEAVRLLADHGLLTYALDAAVARDRSVLRLHRTFGAAARRDLEATAPELCDEVVLRLAGEPRLRDLLDLHGDHATTSRLTARLLRLDELADGADATLGVALHGVAGLLELQGQTRDSGDVFARAERHLTDADHRVLIADCRHGRARTVNQHHQKDEPLLREAVGWARSARRILIEERGEDANADRCLAMEGLLLQKLASFPGPGETELGLLKDALAVIEEADRRRNRPGADVDPAELARSTFNRAGIRIRLARSEPEHAAAHLQVAEEVYEDVRERREAIYRRDVHPHIAACVVGLGYVDYFRALLIAADHRQRSLWLRSATKQATEALRQRSALEGSIDLDEVAKVAAFLAKVALARASAPVAQASVQEGIFDEAMGELTRAGIALASVRPLPPGRAGLAEAIDGWARSGALRAVLTEFEATPPADVPLDELLAWLEDFSRRWDYRAGRERNLVAAPRFAPVTRKVVLAAAEALGLTSSEAPKATTHDQVVVAYDEAIVLGGLVRACLARPLHAAKLLNEGRIEAGAVTALGGFRPIAGDEVGLVERVVGERVDDEFHAMDAGVRNAFGVGEPVSDRGEESDVVGAAWRVREYATASGMPVRVVAAPSSEPGVRRANTADTYAWFATELARLRHGQRVLVVTTEIYVPYQHADALRMLALPYGVEVDVVGVDPGSAHPALRQAFGPHNYLQEIRSTIRALRALHAAL